MEWLIISIIILAVSLGVSVGFGFYAERARRLGVKR